jgi:predicted DNA-binding transcriptional regulator AlpA
MIPEATLAEIIANPQKVQDLPAESIPAVLGEIEHIRASLWARMMSANGNSPSHEQQKVGGEDKLLTAEEAAAILKVSSRWLYRHAKKLPFTRRLSRKVLRFSEAGLRKWQGARRD